MSVNLHEKFDESKFGEDALYLYDLLVKQINQVLNKLEKDSKKELSVLETLLTSRIDTRASKKDLMNLGKSSEAAYASKSIGLSLQNKIDEIKKIKPLIIDVGNLSDSVDLVKVYTREDVISTADLKTLNATPIMLIPKPGEGRFLEIVSLSLFLDYESVAYDGVDAAEDLSLEYETSGQLTQIETTGFLDQASDQRRCIHNGMAHTVGIDEAIILKMLNGEIATGDSPLKYKIYYRILEAIA